MSLILACLKVVIIIRTQGEYIRSIFDTDDYAATDKVSKKYLMHGSSKALANDIATKGFKSDIHKRKLANMDEDQRKSTLRALYDRMFAKKQAAVEIDGFKTKHGRGMDMNHDLFAEEDVNGARAYAAAGVAIAGSRGYRTENIGVKGAGSSDMKSRNKNKNMMMYSSVGDEERQRAA